VRPMGKVEKVELLLLAHLWVSKAQREELEENRRQDRREVRQDCLPLRVLVPPKVSRWSPRRSQVRYFHWP